MALPGPRAQITTDLTAVNVVTEITVTDLRDVTTRLDLVTHLGVMRVGSGPDLSSRPALSPSRLIRRNFRNPIVLRGGLWMSGLQLIIGPCPLHLGHRLIVGPCPSNIIMEDMRVLTRISLGHPMCPIQSSQPVICTDWWAWWCLWLRWYYGEARAGKTPSSSGPVVGCHNLVPARGLGTGLTGSQFLSGFCQKWPGGHLQQSHKVFPSPPGKRK